MHLAHPLIRAVRIIPQFKIKQRAPDFRLPVVLTCGTKAI